MWVCACQNVHTNLINTAQNQTALKNSGSQGLRDKSCSIIERKSICIKTQYICFCFFIPACDDHMVIKTET